MSKFKFLMALILIFFSFSPISTSAESQAITQELCCSEIIDGNTGESVLRYTHLGRCQNWNLTTKEQCALYFQQQKNLNQKMADNQFQTLIIGGIILIIILVALHFLRKKYFSRSGA